MDYTTDGGETLNEANTGDPTPVNVGTLKSKTDSATNDAKLTLTGKAQLLDEATAGTPKGTVFEDTLTYTIQQQ